MQTELMDVSEAQAHFRELLKKVASGVHVIVSEGDKPVAELAPIRDRIPGLHAGAMATTDDFDDPLPEDFWTQGR